MQQTKAKFIGFKIVMIVSFITIGQSVFAGNSKVTYAQALSYYLEQQSESMLLDSESQLAKVKGLQADSWIAGESRLKVHYETDALTGNDDVQNIQVGMSFPVWMPEQKEALQAVSQSHEGIILPYEKFLTWQASRHLRQLTWAYKEAIFNTDIAKQSLSNTQEILKNVQSLFKSGAISKLDRLLVEQEVLNQQRKLQLAESRLKTAQKEYRFWTNQDELPSDMLEPSKSPLDEHPHLSYLQILIDQSELQVQLNKKLQSGQPEFFLGVQEDREANSRVQSLIFEVDVPISGGLNNEVVTTEKQKLKKMAQADLKKAQQKLLQSKQAILGNIQQLKSDLVLKAEQRELNREVMKLTQLSFSLGEIDLYRFLKVKQQSDQVEWDYLQTQLNLNKEIAQLNQVYGYPVGIKK